MENGRIVLDGDRARLREPSGRPGVLSRPGQRGERRSYRDVKQYRRSAGGGMAELDVEHLTPALRRPDRARRRVVCGRAGELFALIGPNGAGKTSVLNCISGIYRGSGAIRFRGSDIAGLRAARNRPARHRPHLPARRAVPADERARQLLAGRHARIRTNPLAEMLFLPERAARRNRASRGGRAHHRVRRAGALSPRAGRRPAVRHAEDRRLRPRAGAGAGAAAARRAVGRPQPRRARGPRALHPAHQARAG